MVRYLRAISRRNSDVISDGLERTKYSAKRQPNGLLGFNTEK